MNWNLENSIVEGMYLGLFPVRGKVELSRVAYGGGVKHSVALENPITVYGALRERVILEHEYVSRVIGG
jgi:hypothetical protein